MKAAAYDYFAKKLHTKADAAERVVVEGFDPARVQKIHFTGICGKAMASLAGLFVQAGYSVTGSDTEWNPPMSTVLEHLGIGFKPFSAENVLGADLVIMGNACVPSNVEAIAARAHHIPQISSAEAYAQFFIKGSRSIVFAGTHGKTTTSSLAAHVFLHSDKSTTVLVGGVMKNIGESYYYGGSSAEYSVVEGDEYDTAYFDKAPKFLHYRPTIGVITSIEFDHADIYTDIDDYLAAFTFFAGEIPPSGYLFLNDQIDPVFQKAIRDHCSAPLYTYGFKETSNAHITHYSIDHERNGQLFSVVIDDTDYTDLFIPQTGTYNLENALAVVAIATREGIAEQSIRTSLETFGGAEQRQQVIYDKKNIVVVEDFAHHPTAVAYTLDGIRAQYPNKRLIAVFEPRSATSRRKDFENRYGVAFDQSDVAIIAKPPVRPGDNETAMMDTHVVVEIIASRGVEAHAFETIPDVLAYLQKILRPNDLVVLMSNGSFGNIAHDLVVWLEQL